MDYSRFTKALLSLAAAIGISASAAAQPLNGTYTIGGTSPSYATIATAVAALNANGVSGPVTFNIRNGSYTSQGTINAVTGASATNRITFQSETGNPANVTISFNATGTANNFVLKLNNASFITIKNLSLKNGGTTYGRVIDLVGSSANDSLINCVLTSPVRTSASTNTAVLFADNLTGSNNVFKGNTFLNGSYSIHYSGTSQTNLVNNGVFIGNTLQNSYTYGAYLYYSNNLKFNSNTVVTNSTDNAFYAIRTYYGDGALEIIGNKVSGMIGGYGIYQYYSDATAANKALIANNVISFGSSTNASQGIRSYYSSYQRFYNNSVNITSTGATTGYAAYFYYNDPDYSTNEIKNNVFANSGGGYALFVQDPTYAHNMDYNNLYTSGAKLVDKGTPAAEYADLTAWRAAHGFDKNSISHNPGFTSATNLQPNAANAASWSLNGRGVQLTGNDKDFNGNTRITDVTQGVPDIGAYEFTPTVAPPNAVATPAAPAAGTTQVFTFGLDTVATITWDASASVPSTITVKQYSGVQPAGITAINPNYMYFYTDISAASGTYNHKTNIYYKESWLGTIAAESSLRLAKKDGSNPWVGSNPAISKADVSRNIISTPGLTSFGLFTGIDVLNNAGIAQVTEPGGFFCGGSLPVKIQVKNNGGNIINNLKIDWQVNGGSVSTINYNTPIASGADAIVTLGTVVFTGAKTIKAWVYAPNGTNDPVQIDDTVQVKLTPGLNGTYTIGGTNPDYATIASAVADLNALGVCGPVTFNIRNGNYAERIQLDNITGLSAANRVTFQSEAHNAANVNITAVSTGTADNYVVRLNSVSYITLKDLTITNTGTTYARVLDLTQDASYDSVVNCKLVGPVRTTASSNTAVLFADPLTGHDNVFIGNTFLNGSYSLYYSGTSTSVLTNKGVFINNTLQNAYTYAAYFYYTSDLKFNNNTITTNSTDNAFYAIRTYYGDGALEIIGNKVSGLLGGYGIYQYYSDATAANKAMIANNVITFGSGTNASQGIRSYYSSYQRFYNNSVNIRSTGATNGYAAYFYYNDVDYSTNEIKNNVFANTGGGYALFVQDPTYAHNMDYNNLYATGPKLVDRGTPAADYTDLTAWRAAHGFDKNSISYNPGFTSATNLQPDPSNAASWSLNGRGVQLADNSKDVNGDPRVTDRTLGVPDIGAYEFEPTVAPPDAVATPATPTAGTTQIFTFGLDTVAAITWDATATVPATISVKQYSGVQPVGITSINPNFMYFYTDINVPAGTYNYASDIYYKESWLGTTAAESSLRLAKKLGTDPWVGYNPNASHADVDRNMISTPNLTDFGMFTGLDVLNNAGVVKITDPAGYFCGGTYAVKLLVKNNGGNTINTLKIAWQMDGGVVNTINHNTPINSGSDVLITLGNVAFNSPHTIKAWTFDPNGVTDPVSLDDTITVKLQPGLSGTYTIGGANPDYATITAAIADLNASGVCGPVVFNIRNGVYNERLQLDSVLGSSAANRITFQSETLNPANVNITEAGNTTDDNYIFRLNNASYVTLKDLTITNTGSTMGRVVELTQSASYDSLVNCRLVGPVRTVANANTAVLFADPLTGNGNAFIGNTFSNGSYSLYYSGTSSSVLTDGGVFVNNTLENAYTYAAYFYYTNNLKFNNNTIVTNSTDNAFYGIRTYYGDGALEIVNNKVTGFLGGYGIYQYYSDATPANKALIANNVISFGSATNTSHGIRSNNSSYQRFYNNSVNITSASATGGYAGYFVYNDPDYSNNEIRNNVFANSGGGFALYVQSTDPALNNTWDYNNLYTAGGGKLVDDITTGLEHRTLDAWRKASGQDMNSISYRPGFTSATDLKPNAADSASWSLNGRGVHIAGNNKDINAGNRVVKREDGVPDIGAYEFTPTSIPPAARVDIAITPTGKRDYYTFGEDTVAVVEWNPAMKITNSLTVRQYSGAIAPGLTSISPSGYMYFYTSIEPSTGSYNYKVSLNYKKTWLGTISNEAKLKLTHKAGTYPWVAYDGISSVNTGNNTVFATNAITKFGLFTAIDSNTLFSAHIMPVGSPVICSGGSVVLNANTGPGYTYQWYNNGAAIAGATASSYTATAIGDYTVTVTSPVKGSSTSFPVTVTIIAPPMANITPSGALTYCPTANLTLSTGASVNNTYQWQLNGTDIPGATGSVYSVTGAGSYTVKVSNPGCETQSAPMVINHGPVTVYLGPDVSTCDGPLATVIDAGNKGAKYKWSTGDTTQTIGVHTSGKYWVEVSAGPGCTATDTVNIMIDPLPVVTGISSQKSGDLYTFSPGGVQHASSYLWIFDHAGVITTFNGIKPEPQKFPNGVKVKLIVFNNCGSDTAEFQETTGVVNTNKTEQNITLYPNPARDNITLELEGAAYLKQLVIVNSVGNVVYQRAEAGNLQKTTVDVSSLPAGYYVIKAMTSEGLVAKPFNILR